MSTLFNNVLVEVKLSFSLNLVKGDSAMQDYNITKLFNIPLKIKRITPAQDIAWIPPVGDIVKINCDGSSIGGQPCGDIGVVFRDSASHFLGALSSNIGHATSLDAEFCAGMVALEKAQSMHLMNIFLETDSIKVFTAFKKDHGVPWHMRARWHNCKLYYRSISCTCVHTLREGNMVADALAKHGQGLSLHSTQWWPLPPPFISSLLFSDSLGLPFTRLVMN
jgi:ribonuclease HI